MPYSDCVSPKSRWTACPAACAPTSAAESAASGAELTLVFHGLSGGSTGQPPTIGPVVTHGAAGRHPGPAPDDRAVGAHEGSARGARAPAAGPQAVAPLGDAPA